MVGEGVEACPEFRQEVAYCLPIPLVVLDAKDMSITCFYS